MLADVYTPVGIYLRLRDKFRDTILLESTDHHSSENSWSFICINAIGGIEVRSAETVEFKLPGRNPEKIALDKNSKVPKLMWEYMQRFDAVTPDIKEGKFAQGLFGYTAYDAVQFFESVSLSRKPSLSDMEEATIPPVRYRLFQYVIAVNHFKDELFICENKIIGVESDMNMVESLIRSKDVPAYPFRVTGEESTNMTD